MTPAQKHFNDLVAKVERANPNLDYTSARNRAKVLHPAEYATAFPQPSPLPLANSAELKSKVARAKEAAAEFLKKVNAHPAKDFNQAWNACLQEYPALANDMNFKLPPGVKLLSDGSAVNTGDASPDELKALGLPVGCPVEIIEVFRQLARVKPSTDVALAMLAALIRADQKDSLLKPSCYEDAKNLISNCFPEIAKNLP